MDPRLSYREATVRGASPVRLVALLYEQAIEDLRQAVDALRRGDIEARTRAVNHAILVIGHLEATLDKDRGGAAAMNLERFYNQVCSALVEAQFQQSPALLEQQISHLILVHEAWCQVEQSNVAPPGAAPPPVPSSGEEVRIRGEWKA